MEPLEILILSIPALRDGHIYRIIAGGTELKGHFSDAPHIACGLSDWLVENNKCLAPVVVKTNGDFADKQRSRFRAQLELYARAYGVDATMNETVVYTPEPVGKTTQPS